MGDSDLTAAPPSLAALIRAGDPDALEGFRESHIAKVRGYCEAACRADRVEEACAAAFLEFLGRIRSAPDGADPDGLLLTATRSAAAGRFDVGRGEVPADCAAAPELLAARANGELRPEPPALAEHGAGCVTCNATAARMSRAEAAFAGTAAF